MICVLLGCTARRAVLGIHRTQAGRRGSSTGRRPAALRLRRRSTLQPPPPVPTAQRPGGAARALGLVPARARNHCHRSRPPSRARARCTAVTAHGPPTRARARCPAGDYATPGGKSAAVTAPGRRCEPGTVPSTGVRATARTGPRGPLTVLHVADRRVATRAFRGLDRRTASPSAGPGAACPDVGGGGSAGAGTPRRDRRGRRSLRGPASPAEPVPQVATQTAAGPVGPTQTK
jgi:hypothetical protein